MPREEELMKKYISAAVAMILMLIALTACYEMQGAAAVQNTIQTAYDVHDICAAATYTNQEANETAQATSWQEAYTEKLRYYAQLSQNDTHTNEAEWRFMLHDINQDGVPELFMVVYRDGFVDHRGIYSFTDGGVVRLKASISGEIYGGMIIPPGGAAGIIRVEAVGVVVRYEIFELLGTALSRTTNGEVVALADIFRINTATVTEKEFDYIFGCRYDKAWLDIYEITGDNIQDIVFGWNTNLD